MASLNKVLLIGNLTRDPEVRFTPGGRAVCDMRLAVSRRFKRANGEDGEETCFVSIVVWDKQGEMCGKYLAKGSPAFVEGRLQLDEWEKDGRKNSTLRVLAERVQFLGGRRPEGGPASPSEGAVAKEETRAPANGESAELPDDENLPF